MSLSSLAAIITSSVNTIEKAAAEAAQSRQSSFSTAKRPPPPTPKAVLEAVDIIVNACAELTAKVQDSPAFLTKHALGFNVSSALRVAVEGHIPEILRPHGAKGLQISDIAHQSDTNTVRLERIMRLLVSHQIFVSPKKGWFANNRHSMALDSGKPAESLPRELSSDKYDGPNELPALVSHSTDEMFKSSSHLAECILEPSTSRAFFGDQSPFSHAFETGMDFRTFLQLSFDQETRLRRFMVAIDCLSTIGNSDSGLSGFNWGSIGNGLIIDVGGGIGHVAMQLARAHPNLRIVLQDRSEVIVQAQIVCTSLALYLGLDLIKPFGGQFWQKRFPKAVTSGRVTLEAHNVLDEEKRRGPSAFFVRFVIREWSDAHSVKILTNLSRASTPTTKLILVERIITDCSEEKEEKEPSDLLAGASLPKDPEISFLGGIEQTGRPLHNLLDAQLMLYGQGRERSLDELARLLAEARWQVKQVIRPGTSSLIQIICSPMGASRKHEIQPDGSDEEEEGGG